jgi:hypothetical protein
MSSKAGSKRAGSPVRAASGGSVQAREGAKGHPARVDAARAALPTMRASARRLGPRTSGATGTPRKAMRPRQRAPGLGGRLAAAIRMARLRAGRAAEESGLRR